jgi:hypothetical protein
MGQGCSHVQVDWGLWKQSGGFEVCFGGAAKVSSGPTKHCPLHSPTLAGTVTLPGIADRVQARSAQGRAGLFGSGGRMPFGPTAAAAASASATAELRGEGAPAGLPGGVGRAAGGLVQPPPRASPVSDAGGWGCGGGSAGAECRGSYNHSLHPTPPPAPAASCAPAGLQGQLRPLQAPTPGQRNRGPGHLQRSWAPGGAGSGAAGGRGSVQRVWVRGQGRPGGRGRQGDARTW